MTTRYIFHYCTGITIAFANNRKYAQSVTYACISKLLNDSICYCSGEVLKAISLYYWKSLPKNKDSVNISHFSAILFNVNTKYIHNAIVHSANAYFEPNLKFVRRV